MRKKNTRVRKMIYSNQVIIEIDEFTYLGKVINNGGRNIKEILKHIYQVKLAFNNKNHIQLQRATI